MPRMREARRRAPKRNGHTPSPPSRFVKVHEWEDWVLLSLPCWMYRLFRCLIEATNYRTGAGSIARAELILAMTPYQPLHGGPRHFVPTHDDIKRALWAFERAGLLARDKRRSEREGSLFFVVHPRRQ